MAWVLGVDFSGASDAGKSLWLAEGELSNDELRISATYSAAVDGDRSRRVAYDRLLDEIKSGQWDVVGLDFPFGLPAGIVSEGTWEEFVKNIDEYTVRGSSGTVADRFRKFCRREADGADLLRKTDNQHGAQCPYGVRVMYQTYYGISKVLDELLDEDDVEIAPQKTNGESTTVVEVYPAATVRHVYDGNSDGYKGTSQTARENRMELINAFPEGTLPIRFNAEDEIDGPRLHALCSDDALDSVLAAGSAARALNDGFKTPGADYSEVEGHIFV